MTEFTIKLPCKLSQQLAYKDATEEGRQAGLKEAAEWLLKNGFLFPGQLKNENDKLEAKLKEWGVR